MKKCAVIGSVNMDIVARVPYFPHPGETMTGCDFRTVPGGKGANQAVALARLGAPVKMAGKVGSDAFGQQYLAHFKANGADVSAVTVDPEIATGIANILVNEEGENYIVLVPGANERCTVEWLDAALEQVKDCEIFLLQLEIPLETVTECVCRLHEMGKTVILDPAPAVPLPEELLKGVDYVTPNETELRILTSGLPEETDTAARVRYLIETAGCTVIHKHGGDGAYIGTEDGIVHVPGFRVKAVDTTAAGDTFNAGFAAGLAMGRTVKEAVRLGNAAGALAVTAFGAQDGMPTLAQAETLMCEQG